MTVATFLNYATEKLQTAGIPSARLDCLILLEDVLGQDRASLLAHPELTLTPRQTAILNNNITQRAQSIPLAYIRGKSAFYGREFIVNSHVLVPRPESETMIDMLLEDRATLPDNPRIADIGTGSGCLGITTALELPTASVHLYDIDPAALRVAAENAQSLKATVHIAQSNLLESAPEQFDCLLANLPYVPNDYTINAAARFEPRLALFAGDDGLDAYRALWSQLASRPAPPAQVYTEALPFQHAALARLAQQAGYILVAARDLIQHFSVQ